MKRFSIIFAVAVVVILAVGVLAESSSVSLSGDIEEFVKNIAEKRGVPENEIKDVKQVDFYNLPEEVNIQNIDNTTLAIYEVNIGQDRPVYVITASEIEFKKELQNFAGRMLLNLGLSGEFTSSEFMKSAAGVSGGEEKGYVMIRDGSITGISTSLEVEVEAPGKIAEIIIYKNGEIIGFRNTFDLSEKGTLSDYNTVSEGIVNFNKGDTISVKALVPEGTKLKDINTLLEVTNRE